MQGIVNCVAACALAKLKFEIVGYKYEIYRKIFRSGLLVTTVIAVVAVIILIRILTEAITAMLPIKKVFG